MSESGKQVFTVAYDISSDKIRTNVFKRLKKSGKAVQKSVFILKLGKKERQLIETFLRGVIEDGDSYLVIPCCEKCIAKSTFHCKKMIKNCEIC